MTVASLLLTLIILGSPAGGLLAADAFAVARPGWQYRFPRDHAAHPQFRTEWWYYTGHLETADGRPFGYQLTFFRVGLGPPRPGAGSAWAATDVYFAHLALTDIAGKKFVYREKAGRAALGIAGADTHRYRVWIDDWRAALADGDHQLRARDPQVSLDLTLTPQKPPVIHGTDGLSRKAAGEGYASHYYSLTRLATRGALTWEGQTFPVTGLSWMDHEFSSSQLAPDQTGWDWFSLQLDDGCDLMLYLLRRADGSLDPHSSGTLVDSQGGARHLRLADFQVQPRGSWKSPRSAAVYPAAWRLTVPAAGYELTLTPTLPDQELVTTLSTQVTYWEGGVRVTGKRDGQPVSGRGYVELTGYAGSLGGRF